MKRTSAQVKAELKALRDRYEAIIARNDPADDAELRETDTKIEALVQEYSQRAQDEQRVTSNREAMKAIFGADVDQQPTSDGGPRADARPMSIGKQFISNPQFSRWLQEMTAGGPVPEGMRITSPSVPVPQLGATLVTGLSSTSGGAFVVNDRTNIVVPAVRDELNVTDLLTRMTTESDTVEYVRVTSETNAAAPTLEATSSADGAKPESAAAFAIVSAIVESIPHWIPITRRAMSDAPQLAAYIDDLLLWGLRDALNDQVINGTGSTPQLAGIDDLSGKQSQAWSNDILETTRKARTLVRTTGGARPTAYVMNPTDWEGIDLLQDNENRYFFGGPTQVGVPVLWGLPVVEDEDVTAGLGFVGAWNMGVIWTREQARILMTDSHSDFFIRNILVLLAEMRCAIGWLRPAAFVEIDLTAA